MTKGGSRKGAGRRADDPPTRQRCIRLSEEHVKLLRMWGRGDLTAGIRWLIEVAAPLVHKKKKEEKRVDGQE